MSSPPTPPIPRPRHDGWTADKQKVFIRVLATLHNVWRAAAAAGMSRESAYRLRRRAEGVALAQTWELDPQPSAEAPKSQ